jgi:hypothetical protein
MPKEIHSIPDLDYGDILTKHATLAAMEISALIGKEVPVSVVSIMTAHLGQDRAAQSFGMAGQIGITEGAETHYMTSVLKNSLTNVKNLAPGRMSTHSKH